jgi:hypothetical protein
MTGSQPLDLLARAAKLMDTSLDDASRAMPTLPTPCREWDLGTLVHHIAHSVSDLADLLEGRGPTPAPRGGCTQARAQIERLENAITQVSRDDESVELTALAGAFELALHAWDLNESAGSSKPLPADLASALLSLAPVVLNNIERRGLFDASLPPSAEQRTDTDRLVALFGRRASSG